MKVAIVNYGMGNITSVHNALSFLNVKSVLVNTPSDLKNYDKFILPGVGAFGPAIKNLAETGLKDALHEEVLGKKKPFIGLCLGMQLLFSDSNEHGMFNGFNWVPGHVKGLEKEVPGLRVPHVGWNDVNGAENSLLLKGLEPKDAVFYFVHSYACFCNDSSHVKGKVSYGTTFDVVVEHQNIFGCQFHPEKSQKSGLHVLKNFAAL